MPQSAYLHIPFCHHICHYCDFNKVFLKNQPVDEYLTYMEKEMVNTIQKFPTNSLQTIFVGGGTPTALSVDQLDVFLTAIEKQLSFDKNNVEYTFEANPGELSLEKLQLLKQYGVNRLSFGVQSFNDELLKYIGRSHRKQDVYRTLDLARQAGFTNISIDLIYSLPNQTIEDFKETLKEALSLEMEHYSAYSLIIEPKTVFYNLMNKGKLPLPTQDEEATMYDVLINEMEKHHINQYEISNFAKSGFESQHNLTYWNNNEYYGFGAGAHSYVNGVRRSNFGPLKKYIDQIKATNFPFNNEQEVTKQEQMEEELFLGLRKSEGVSISLFEKKYNDSIFTIFEQPIKDNINKGYLEQHGNFIRLTREGKFLGNEVFQSFLSV